MINTAAYTAVDKAESDVVAAWRLNALAPAILAAATAERQIPLVHVSTDYVFAGTKPDGAYAPDEPIDPQSVYGASKAAGRAGGAHGQSAARHRPDRLGGEPAPRQLRQDDAAARRPSATP